jgi:hypothetical protein
MQAHMLIFSYARKENIYTKVVFTYKDGPEGFIYKQEGNYWICPNNKKVKFRNQRIEKIPSRTFIEPEQLIVRIVHLNPPV